MTEQVALSFEKSGPFRVVHRKKRNGIGANAALRPYRFFAFLFAFPAFFAVGAGYGLT
jgi:hypothetical protein